MSTVGISFKVNKALREQFNAICEREGYSSSLVHRKLMEQYIKSKTIPVSKNIPNAETLAAMRNVEAGKNLQTFSSVDELFEDLGI